MVTNDEDNDVELAIVTLDKLEPVLIGIVVVLDRLVMPEVERSPFGVEVETDVVADRLVLLLLPRSKTHTPPTPSR